MDRIGAARRRLVRMGALVLVAALAAACGGGAEQQQTGGGGGETAAGERLVVLTDDVASSINPDGPEAASPATIAAIGNLHDTLIGYPVGEPDADGVLVPDYGEFTGHLAESWSQDGNTWTFNATPPVTGKLSDGNVATGTITSASNWCVTVRNTTVDKDAPTGGATGAATWSYDETDGLLKGACPAAATPAPVPAGGS